MTYRLRSCPILTAWIASFFLCSWLGGGLLAQTHQKLSGSLPTDAGYPQVIDFLTDQLPALQAPEVGLVLATDRLSPGGRHLQFWQTYRGQPIHTAGVKLNLGRDGRIWSVMNHLITVASVSQTPAQVDPDRVMARYTQALNAIRISYTQGWWSQQGRLIPIIRLESYQQGPVHAYELLVDARDGSELQRRDLAAYAHPEGDSTGVGRVFAPDPCTRAEAEYGIQFNDNDDLHSALLEQMMDTVLLPDLTYEGGVFHLRGPHVKIEDIQPFSLAPATSTDGQFIYPRDDARFEDVMVYYHIDRYQRYVQSLGFTNLQNKPFRADPHGLSNSDQSLFVGNQGDGYILLGDGGVDDAEDADVIVHEYGHALSYAAAPETRTGKERSGLDEGIGDYIAASYSYDLSNWNWFMIFNWDGHNEFWPGRTAISSITYPLASSANIYDYGEVWATSLMSIRSELGGAIMDRLVLQSLYGNANQMTLTDGAKLILEADSMLYSGAHTEILSQYFCSQNLLVDVGCLAVEVADPETPAFHPTGTVASLPGGNYRLQWPGHRPVELTLFSQLGQMVWQGTCPAQGELIVPLQGMPAGVYLLRWQGSKGMTSQKLLRY
jgi:hypothetical protein